MVAARVTRAEHAAFGAEQAHRLPNAVEPVHEVVSGAGERWLGTFVRMEDRAAVGDIAGRHPHPPQAGSKAFPQGSLVAHGDDVSDPRHGKKSATSTSLRGSFSTRKRGSLTSTLWPRCRTGTRQYDALGWRTRGQSGAQKPATSSSGLVA